MPFEGRESNAEPARRRGSSTRAVGRIVLGNVCAAAVGVAMAMASSPAVARSRHHHFRKRRERVSARPFGDIPKGPLQLFISIDEQELHLYSDGQHVADAPVATGVPGHLTPLGVFNVIERDRYHHSNLYYDAPMFYMQRITWSGVALHEGPGVGHEASHGCIRMPRDFAARLWRLHTMGMSVIIANPELRPTEIADPLLFVHKNAPPTTASLPPTAKTSRAGTPGVQAGPVVAVALRGAPVDPATAAHAAHSAPAAAAKSTQPAAATAAPSHPALPAVTMAPQGDAAAMPPPGGTAPVAAPLQNLPLPPSRPARLARADAKAPIAIFISRKTSKIYVRQDFTPVFDAPVTIENPKQPFGTYVFTALNYLPDHATLRWTVVSLPSQTRKVVERWKYVRNRWGRRRRVKVKERIVEPSPALQTPQQALARIEIPQDVRDQISRLIVPGSSLVISDHGLGQETGEGTDFIVVMR